MVSQLDDNRRITDIMNANWAKKDRDAFNYVFDLVIDNDGNTNVTDFKLEADLFTARDSFPNKPQFTTSLFFRDGHPDPRKTNNGSLSVKIYPGDKFLIYSFTLTSVSPLEFLHLKWKLYLGNNKPISGQIDVLELCNDNPIPDEPGEAPSTPPLPIKRAF